MAHEQTTEQTSAVLKDAASNFTNPKQAAASHQLIEAVKTCFQSGLAAAEICCVFGMYLHRLGYEMGKSDAKNCRTAKAGQ